jgi:hypothetical protein
MVLQQQETQPMDTLVVAPGPRSTMDKVTYSNDTTAAVPGANLSVASSGLAATGNSTAGYFGGGQSWSSINNG